MAASGAIPIILYHSTTGAAVPSNTNLSPGELAVNIADMKLYCENDSGVVTLLSSADAAAGNFTTVDINGGTIDGSSYRWFYCGCGVIHYTRSILDRNICGGGRRHSCHHHHWRHQHRHLLSCG
jgi:hypothetical protein